MCEAALPETKRAVIDILYGECVALLWRLPSRTARSTQSPHRPQPDWWDFECYDLTVARNAAFRLWRREHTPAARAEFRAKRLQFHHLVRRKKAQFWNTWLHAQEQLAHDNPRLAAPNIRQQMGMQRRTLPHAMRSSDSCGGGIVEGPACLDAWRANFRDVPLDARPAASAQTDSQVCAVAAAAQQLRNSMRASPGNFDFPFSEGDLLQVLQELPCDRSPGPDGLPYEAFRVDDECLRSSLLVFFELVRSWSIVPTVWRSAIVAPLHKGGPADQFTNYRPISLLCSCQKVFERLVLKRLLPRTDPQLDESQAGFRWGAEEQVYTLAETLRLRAGRRTFCAFVDVRKAFDVAWRDTVLVKLAAAGVTGSLWPVIADPLSNTTARASVNGSLSEPWSELAGVRQGSVLGPVLFNLLFDSVAEAVRAACPGVKLGNGPRAPRVTLLLYADDLVILADNLLDLQNALIAVGVWGSQWRISFGVGPDNTAVLVVGSRGWFTGSTFRAMLCHASVNTAIWGLFLRPQGSGGSTRCIV